MDTCSSCRHWLAPDGIGAPTWAMGPEPEDLPNDIGVCALSWSRNATPRQSETRAYALDYECVEAYLMTYADFGCTQWSAGDS